MKILLIYLQPKDGLTKVTRELYKMPCDVLKLKYFPYPKVYNIARKTIESHPEYTHIIWLQNDIVFKKADYLKLCEDFQSTGGQILGCSMNVDLSDEGMKKAAFTTSKFEHTITGFLNTEPPYAKRKNHQGLVKVYHNGGPFMCTREFYLKFPLTGMGKTGVNADLDQGRRIWNSGIDYLVDTDIHLLHLRYKGKMKVGKKPEEIEVIRND